MNYKGKMEKTQRRSIRPRSALVRFLDEDFVGSYDRKTKRRRVKDKIHDVDIKHDETQSVISLGDIDFEKSEIQSLLSSLEDVDDMIDDMVSQKNKSDPFSSDWEPYPEGHWEKFYQKEEEGCKEEIDPICIASDEEIKEVKMIKDLDDFFKDGKTS